MSELTTYIIVFASTLIGVGFLGAIAGFSPTLYIAQIAIGAKPERRVAYTIALIAGVFAAILFLMVLFQWLHVDTVVTYIDSTIHALLYSVIFNLLIGIAFIWGGTWYLRNKKDVAVRKAASKKSGGIAPIFSLGFVRTLTSISGVTSVYIAANGIASVSTHFFEQLIYSLVFFVAALIPFVGIVSLMMKNPALLTDYTDKLKLLLNRFNYRAIAGIGAIVLGSAIVMYSALIAILY